MVIIWLMMANNNLVGGWAYPSEKWWSESQLGWWHSQLNGKKSFKCSSHHQPEYLFEIAILMGKSWSADRFEMVWGAPDFQTNSWEIPGKAIDKEGFNQQKRVFNMI